MSSLVGSEVCLAKNTLPQVPVFRDRDALVRLRTGWSRDIPGESISGKAVSVAPPAPCVSRTHIGQLWGAVLFVRLPQSPRSVLLHRALQGTVSFPQCRRFHAVTLPRRTKLTTFHPATLLGDKSVQAALVHCLLLS